MLLKTTNDGKGRKLFWLPLGRTWTNPRRLAGHRERVRRSSERIVNGFDSIDRRAIEDAAANLMFTDR
ncbi:MAG: hypothetical protein OSB02_13125, partial [Rhodospirillaceae bacterium]|nr:hypothetical protein [Rhodospirillaceae bacterium]